VTGHCLKRDDGFQRRDYEDGVEPSTRLRASSTGRRTEWGRGDQVMEGKGAKTRRKGSEKVFPPRKHIRIRSLQKTCYPPRGDRMGIAEKGEGLETR